MKAETRIIVNTVILYLKILVCMGLALFTVPIVLHALGTDDFGLYSVLAGVIAMLAFINGSMALSTQRYLSVTLGEGNIAKVQQVFNLSMLMHLLIGIGVVIIIEAAKPLLFAHALNIPDGRADVASLLYHLLAVNVFISIITVPFDAELNAYENMLVFSIISIVEAVLKLIAALILTMNIGVDKLAFYGIALCLCSLAILLMKAGYCLHRYRDLPLSVSACRNMALFREMFSFAGWNTLNALAFVTRTQGVAVVLNHFWGTAVNASYGIGQQVNGVLGYFSSTIQKSVNPQLMMSEGEGDEGKLFGLSMALTKFSCLCLTLVAIPLLIEMPTILRLWLGTIPPYAVEFTRLIILLALIYQASAGVMSAIQSSGRIKWYAIVICIILTASIPLTFAGIMLGISPKHILWLVCLSEAVAFVVRLMFARHLIHFPVVRYSLSIVLPLALQAVAIFLVLALLTTLMPPSIWRVALICVADVPLFAATTWLLLTAGEKEYVVKAIEKLKN